MGRKRRKNQQRTDEAPSEMDGELQHRPFAALKADLKADLKVRRKLEQKKRLDARPSPATASPATRSPLAKADSEGEGAFAEAMAGVQPLVRRDPRVPPPQTETGIRRADDEAEAMAELADLVAGRGDFDTLFSDEHIEGVSNGVDAKLLKRLRRGAFSVRRHLDLHGYTKQDARVLVERFLEKARRDGHRCVLIVHGRGLHSKDGIPVLKQAVNSWLLRGRIARSVLAFCNARPADGGLGAIYVLLRK